MATSDILTGLAYRLRPVIEADASQILDLRSDAELTRYLPPLRITVDDQRNWITKQIPTPFDYYWIVERLHPEKPSFEGMIGLYGGSDEGYEWGRWILKKGSMAAAESAFLVYQYAFETLKAPAVWCQSVVENRRVVAFHDACGLEVKRILEARFTIGDTAYDAIEHYLSQANWPATSNYLDTARTRTARLLNR